MSRTSIPNEPSAPTPPSNVEAERSVLGALLIDSETINTIAAFLRPEDFYRGQHAAIYEAILSLSRRNEPADFVTITDELERSERLQGVGGSAYLASLIQSSPTAAHVEHYARTVERHATCRRLIQAAQNIAVLGYETPDDVDAAITQSEALLFEVRRGRYSGRLISPMERAKRAADRYTELHEGGVAGGGLRYGFADIDGLTQGARPGELIIVAGRPSMGKSAWMQSAAEHMAQAGSKVLIASAEMPEWQLTDRAIAGRVKVNMQRLQEPPFGDGLWASISETLGELSEEPVWVYDDPDMTTASIRAVATEMRSRHGLDALVVDYLQLLHDRHGSNDNERVGRMSRELKAIARSLAVPVICGSQLNRECESRANKKPQLSDLRDSGSVEQDADAVFLMHRDAYYWTENEWYRLSGNANKPYPKNLTEIIVAKQRNGPRGKSVNLYFDLETFQFHDLEQRYA